MGRVLVIGAGGVSTVAVKKIAMNADVFTEIMVASRTKSKCDKIAADIRGHQERESSNRPGGRRQAQRVGGVVRGLQAGLGRQPGVALSGSLHHGRVPGIWRQLPRHGQLRAARRGNGNGPIRSASSRRASRRSSDADSTRALQVSIPPTRQNTISTRFTIWIS